MLSLNVIPETSSEVNRSSFECLAKSAIWVKVLVAIDQRNKIIRAQNYTIDIEIKNIESLINDLKLLRLRWKDILSEAKKVAGAM